MTHRVEKYSSAASGDWFHKVCVDLSQELKREHEKLLRQLEDLQERTRTDEHQTDSASNADLGHCLRFSTSAPLRRFRRNYR